MGVVTKFGGTSKPLQWKIDCLIFTALQIHVVFISHKQSKLVQQPVGLIDTPSSKKPLKNQRLKFRGPGEAPP